MTLRWLIASLHLLALGIGFGAIYARSRALRRASTPADLAPAFLADTWWGVAGLLWLVTGLWRAFGGLEKGTEYYLHHPLFHAKLTLFVLIVLLEVLAGVTLMRWRGAARSGGAIDYGRAKLISRIGHVELLFILVMLFLGTAIARGIGYPS